MTKKKTNKKKQNKTNQKKAKEQGKKKNTYIYIYINYYL